MAGLTSQLLPAIYKNLPFFVRSETIDQLGQKRVIHDYPGTSNRYIEPQGKVPFEGTMEIFFKGPGYIQTYKLFKRLLEKPAPGRLFMPTFGIFNNVVTLPATATSDHTEIGVISLTVKFSETIEKPSPLEEDSTEEDVFELGEEARVALQAVFIASYIAPATLSNAETSSADFLDMAGTINNLVGAESAFRIFSNSFPKKLKDPNGLGILLLNPVAPIGYMQGIAINQSGLQAFNKFKAIATVGNSISNSMNDIRAGISPKRSTVTPDSGPTTEINVNINVWDNDTAERELRNANRYAAVNIYRLVGLIGMYEQAGSRSYTTTEEIDSVLALLEQYYEALIENDVTGIIVPELKPTIDQLKALTEQVLKIKRQNAYTVIEVKVEKPYSSKLLAYELYGEYIKNETQLNTMAALITGLNRSLPAYKLEGTVRVVEIG